MRRGTGRANTHKPLEKSTRVTEEMVISTGRANTHMPVEMSTRVTGKMGRGLMATRSCTADAAIGIVYERRSNINDTINGKGRDAYATIGGG